MQEEELWGLKGSGGVWPEHGLTQDKHKPSEQPSSSGPGRKKLGISSRAEGNSEKRTKLFTPDALSQMEKRGTPELSPQSLSDREDGLF